MNLDKQPEISSIVLIDEYLDVDNKTVGKHPFVVLSNDTEFIDEKRYNIVAVALSSYKNKLQRKKNRIFNTSVDLFSPEEVDYLVENNLIDGAMNKLAYYRLVNDFKEDFIYQGEKKCLVKVKKRNEKKGLANH